MLVLSRRPRQSVEIAQDVRITVTAIADPDSGCLPGLTARLGFDSPRSVAITRAELRRPARRADSRSRRPKQRRPGRWVTAENGLVWLRIDVPPQVPVCLNGRPCRAMRTELHGDGRPPTTVYQLLCRSDDRITICHNIAVAVVEIVRFVFAHGPGDAVPPREAGAAAAEAGQRDETLGPPQRAALSR